MVIESMNMKHQENIVKKGRVSGFTSDLVGSNFGIHEHK